MITLAQQIAIQRWTAKNTRARHEYELVKLEAAGKCIECGIRLGDLRRPWYRRLKCWACRKGLGPPKVATS